MAVYIVPRNRYYGGFLGALGQGAAGLVTNLLGSQLNAMIERGNEARKVRQYDKFLKERAANLATVGATGMGGGDATRQQEEFATLNSPHYVLQTEDTRNRWDSHQANNEQTRGWEQQWRAFDNLYGEDAANTLVGMQRAGTDPSIQRQFVDLAVPTYGTSAIDQGDRTTLRFSNPRNPGDYREYEYDHSLSPQDILNAELAREGHANALEQQRLRNQGIVSGSMARGRGGRGGGTPVAGDIPKMVEALAKTSEGLELDSPQRAINNALITMLGNAYFQQGGLPMQFPTLGGNASQAPDREATINIFMQNNPDISREEAESLYDDAYGISR